MTSVLNEGQHSNHELTSAVLEESNTTQNFETRQQNKLEEEEEQRAKRTRTKKRPTKVGLNDTLRRIRRLIIEG